MRCMRAAALLSIISISHITLTMQHQTDELNKHGCAQHILAYFGRLSRLKTLWIKLVLLYRIDKLKANYIKLLVLHLLMLIFLTNYWFNKGMEDDDNKKDCFEDARKSISLIFLAELLHSWHVLQLIIRYLPITMVILRHTSQIDIAIPSHASRPHLTSPCSQLIRHAGSEFDQSGTKWGFSTFFHPPFLL